MSVYLVWSNYHSAWWGPNRSGYCGSIEHAGRYSRDAALAICKGARGGREFHGNPTEVPVLLEDARAFWPDDKPEWEATRRRLEQRDRQALLGEDEPENT